MLDLYFKYSIAWDYLLSMLIALITWYLVNTHCLAIPTQEHLYSTISDMSTIALTMAGFILTLLTVLISFKSANKIDKDQITEDDKVFDVFFTSKLYFQTVTILKNAIKSLTIIAITGYVLKLTVDDKNYHLLFFFCVFGVIVILLTLWRSILILASIVKMQEVN